MPCWGWNSYFWIKTPIRWASTTLSGLSDALLFNSDNYFNAIKYQWKENQLTTWAFVWLTYFIQETDVLYFAAQPIMWSSKKVHLKTIFLISTHFVLWVLLSTWCKVDSVYCLKTDNWSDDETTRVRKLTRNRHSLSFLSLLTTLKWQVVCHCLILCSVKLQQRIKISP